MVSRRRARAAYTQKGGRRRIWGTGSRSGRRGSFFSRARPPRPARPVHTRTIDGTYSRVQSGPFWNRRRETTFTPWQGQFRSSAYLNPTRRPNRIVEKRRISLRRPSRSNLRPWKVERSQKNYVEMGKPLKRIERFSER